MKTIVNPLKFQVQIMIKKVDEFYGKIFDTLLVEFLNSTIMVG